MIPIKNFTITKTFVYKVDVLEELKKRGYTSYVLHDKIGFAMSSYIKLKNKEMVNTKSLLQICSMLNCKVEDIIDTVDVDENNIDPLA